MIRGNSTVRNIIIDNSCAINGTNFVGGIAAGCQTNTTNGVTIENCINHANVSATGNVAGGIFGQNFSGDIALIIRNCGNTGNVTVPTNGKAIAGWVGANSANVLIENCWNIGDVSSNSPTNNLCNADAEHLAARVIIKNCYDIKAPDGYTQGTKLSSETVASGELCAKLGYGFRQNLGEDTQPNLDADHGFVTQIGAAGYSTMYNKYSDVTIPVGIEAFAGVINGNHLSLVSITEKIKASEPVVLKLVEGTDAGLFNFMPTTGASDIKNDLLGSDGNITGAEGNIYALSKQNGKVGFYKVGTSVTIPEGRVYLEYDSTPGSEVRGFTFDFDDEDDPNGIVSPLGETEERVAVYNIAGQRLNKMQKGINIVNGKKVLK